MTVTVNGTDITPYIAFGGLGREVRRISNEIVTMDGTKHRAVKATKIDRTITFRTMNDSELHDVMGVFEENSVELVIEDYVRGSIVQNMLVQDYSNGLLVVRENESIWLGASVKLQEV